MSLVEKRLLSACIVGGPGVVADAASRGVAADSFREIEHGQIWAGLVEACAKDKQTGAFFVARRAFGAPLARHQIETVAEIAKLESTSAFARELADEVVGEHKRAIVAGCLANAVSAAKEAPKWTDAWERIAGELSGCMRAASAGRTVELGAMVDVAIAEEINPKPPGKVGVGVQAVDDAIGLVAPGEVCVLAGRPGVGKTALALQMADGVVKAGGCAMIVSLEMTATALLRRVACQRAGEYGQIQRGCSKTEYAMAKEARVRSLESLRQCDGRLHIYEAGECRTVARIEARARLIASRAVPLDCILVDYIGLIQPDDMRISREQQVAQISRRIKLLALELNAPIVLLSQLNRASEKDERAPRLFDLRESGSIEQDADRVWLLYPSPNSPLVSDSPSAQVRLEQAKCRNGQAGQAVDLTFRKAAFTFTK